MRLPLSRFFAVLLLTFAALPAFGGVEDGTPEECCDSSLCDSCCVSSMWTAQVGYVHMWRERIGSDFGVWEDTANNPVYTAAGYDFDSASGADVSLAWENGCGKGVVFRYLGLEEFTAADRFGPFGITTRLATNPTGTNWGAGFAFDTRYASDLQSFEALYQRRFCRTNLTLGFRYVDLDEELSIRSIPVTGPYRFQTENKLYGFQIGLDRELWETCYGVTFDATAKAGIYCNDTYARSASTGTNSSGQTSEDRAAFVGELGLAARYDINCCWSVTAGYQLMFIDGVTLAADQVPNTGRLNVNNNHNVPVIADSNSLLYHGLNVGVEFRR